MTTPYQPGKISVSPQDLWNAQQQITSCANEIGNSITTVFGTNSDPGVLGKLTGLSWSGDASNEAKDMVNAVFDALGKLFTTQGSKKAGSIDRLTSGMASGSANYDSTEQQIVKMFNEMSMRVTTPGNPGANPQSVVLSYAPSDTQHLFPSTFIQEQII